MRTGLRLREIASSIAIILLGSQCASSTGAQDAAPAAEVAAATPKPVETAAAAPSPARAAQPSGSAQAAAANAAPGARRALLIGINDYAVLPGLRGAINDVESIKQTLITRLGFREDQIRVLTDKQATRAGILAALEQLVKDTKPDEFVYIHYSGHGSQAKDMNGDEEDGRDETIVPQDGRTPGVPDITDDELAEIIARLKAKEVVVVLDSCHSGTATRSIVATRAVPMDTRDELYDRPMTRAIVPVEDQHVLFTAASQDQKALDGPVDGRSHGLFTFALARAITEEGPQATPRQILDGVQHELERVKDQLGLRDMPEPQLEGPPSLIDRALLAAPEQGTAPAKPARLAWVGAEAAGTGRVVLHNGVSLGAVPKSTWAIYPPGETEFAPGAALAQTVIEEVKGSDSFGKLDPDKANIATDSRAVPISPPPPPPGLTVGWLGGDAEARARVESALHAQLPDVHFVSGDSFARYLLELKDQSLRVYGADGVYLVAEIPRADESALITELSRIFGRSMTTGELLALDNPAAGISLQIEVATRQEPTAKREGKSRALLVVADTSAPRYRIRKPDEPRTPENSLQLAVRASKPCYLTLIDVDAEGTITQLLPNALSEGKGFYPDGQIPADQRILVPDSLANGNAAGFHIDYAPPAGTDTVRGFCVTRAETAHSLRDAIKSIAGATRGIGSRGADTDLGEILRTRFGGLRGNLAKVTSRGVALVASDAPSATAVAAATSAGAAAGSPAPESGASQPPAATATMGPAPDWTAASLTIHVQ